LPEPLLVGQVRPSLPRLFTDFRMVCFPLAGVLTVNTGLTTLLSIALRRCRPAASSVWMLPLSLQAGQYSPVLPGLLSSAPELVRLSSIARFPSSDFQPHGSQDLTGLVDASGSVTRRMLRSAYYPCCFEGKTPRVLTSRSSASWPPTILCQESHPTRRSSGLLRVASVLWPAYQILRFA